MKPFSALAFACLLSGAASAALSDAPVTPQATGGARKLYNFLATNYGVRTVSGMMTGEVGSGSDVKALIDIDSLHRRSGKYPVLIGFDFLFATGVKASDSWYQSYTASTLSLAKDLWAKGGIPAFTWHWKDPSDSIDAFYTPSGNAKEYTTFDFTKGFVPGTTRWDTTSTTYRQLVADIDEIAALFLKLQRDSVAAVFRPLHEASGGWFWWGTKGGPAFQALYGLVHDRMVDVDGVRNLVWVWNPNAPSDVSWNPGASRYDVISLDIYGAWDYSKKFSAGYQELTKQFGTGNKIFAVSENGPIPDASAMKKQGAVWSWWMPWYQTWDGRFLDQTVDAVWKANMADPCVVTLDEMPGWASYTMASAPVAACTNAYDLGQLDSARHVVERVPGDTAANGWLRVQYSTPADDTAKGNIIVAQAATGTSTVVDLSTATTLKMKVVNGNTQTGIWFTVAFLGNQNANWGWAQPDGCWINAGDSTTCTIDLTTTTQDKVVLKGASYTAFMSNLNKIYFEIFGLNWSGSVYFDDLVAGTTVINAFDKAGTYKAESPKNLVGATIVGARTNAGIGSRGSLGGISLTMRGRSLQLQMPAGGWSSLALLDLQGRRLASLHEGFLSSGAHDLSLDRVTAPGVYLVRLKGPEERLWRVVVE